MRLEGWTAAGRHNADAAKMMVLQGLACCAPIR